MTLHPYDMVMAIEASLKLDYGQKLVFYPCKLQLFCIIYRSHNQWYDQFSLCALSTCVVLNFAHAIFFCVCRKGEIPSTPLCVLYTRLADLFCDVTFAQAHWVCVRKSSALQIACGDSGISPFFCTQNRANSLQREEFPRFDANLNSRWNERVSNIKYKFSWVFESFDIRIWPYQFL